MTFSCYSTLYKLCNWKNCLHTADGLILCLWVCKQMFFGILSLMDHVVTKAIFKSVSLSVCLHIPGVPGRQERQFIILNTYTGFANSLCANADTWWFSSLKCLHFIYWTCVYIFGTLDISWNCFILSKLLLDVSRLEIPPLLLLMFMMEHFMTYEFLRKKDEYSLR